MARVDEIYEELQEIHIEFSAEQLRAWAHMVELGKHTSLEEPPDKPFFQGNKCRQQAKKKPCSARLTSTSIFISPHREPSQALINTIVYNNTGFLL